MTQKKRVKLLEDVSRRALFAAECKRKKCSVCDRSIQAALENLKRVAHEKAGGE